MTGGKKDKRVMEANCFETQIERKENGLQKGVVAMIVIAFVVVALVVVYAILYQVIIISHFKLYAYYSGAEKTLASRNGKSRKELIFCL